MADRPDRPDRPDDRPPAQPLSPFDRALSAMQGLPNLLSTTPTIIQDVPYLFGPSQTFIVQTKRMPDEGDTIFLRHITEERTVQIVIPPKVTKVIARQRDSLTARSRKRGAQQAVKTKQARQAKE